ncbi:MAG: hypothetical protein DWH78_05295 [Planctomycetota bacterium]|nr:MAG: hypothetical protein DWH78_05295 [Planctomycetota bacterium]
MIAAPFAAWVDVTGASKGEAPIRVGRSHVDPTGPSNSLVCNARPSAEFCEHRDLPHGSWPEVGTGATNLPDRFELAISCSMQTVRPRNGPVLWTFHYIDNSMTRHRRP